MGERVLKVVIVGCGQIADGHAGEIQKIPNARLAAVCDLEILMAEQLARRFGVPAHYDDFEAMLEKERPDVVHICTPPAAHLQLARAAMDAGAHVYVEKPFALTYEETSLLVDHATATGRKMTVGHNYDFDPAAEDARRLIADGRLGEIVHVESWFGYDLAGPFGRALLSSPDHWVRRLPGKLFHNNISHAFARVAEFVQDDRPEIHAVAWQRAEAREGLPPDPLFDELRVVVRGAHVSAYLSFSAHARPVVHLQRICGTRNTLRIDFGSRTVALERGPTLPSAVGRLLAGYLQSWQYARSASANLRRFLRYDYHFFAGLQALIQRFYASILKDTPPPIATRDILRIAWMMDEVFAQIGSRPEPPSSGMARQG